MSMRRLVQPKTPFSSICRWLLGQKTVSRILSSETGRPNLQSSLCLERKKTLGSFPQITKPQATLQYQWIAMIHNYCGNHLVVQQHHHCDAKTQTVWTQECQFKQGSPDIAITTNKTLEIGQEVGVASFGTKGKNCDKDHIRNGVTCTEGIDDLRGKPFFWGAPD
jgi:hypothetical protein